ncbi:hypothetical protein BD560DRAFT_132218 [Blakeslea trispora]|nr:hypothetical protein BD560DRAFT_132218 [Blakeslea trispora]
MSLSKISLERVFNMNKKVSPSQRQAIRMWFFSLYEKKDVEAVWAKIKRTIENIEHMNTTNPAAQLDIMAVKLLQKFDSLSGDEMVVLKLAISHIVDLLNEDLLDVYRAYVDPLFWDVLSCSAQQPKEEDEEDIVVREVFEKLVKICQEKPLKKAKLDIVKERAKMMEEEREDTLKYNLLLICDFLLTNIGEWANEQDDTEAEVVERLSQMLRLLFMNTKLTVKT